jgi:hypothetical protein
MHFTGELMSRRVREGADIRVVSLPAVPVATAQPRCKNLDYAVVVARLWDVKRDDVDAAAELGILQSEHGGH